MSLRTQKFSNTDLDCFRQYQRRSFDTLIEAGMPVILDAAPIYDGYLVDTSLPFSFGDNALMDEMTHQLQAFRPLIKDGVNAGKTFQAIELEVNEMIHDLGFQNCHRKHIGAVLGHRVMKVSNRPWNRLKIKQLGVRQVGWFYWKSILAKKGWQNDSPNWNQYKTSDHEPFHGLWAVEPHFAKDGVGTKFEEILVIGDGGAEWLDEDLPHTRFWRGESMLCRRGELVHRDQPSYKTEKFASSVAAPSYNKPGPMRGQI